MLRKSVVFRLTESWLTTHFFFRPAMKNLWKSVFFVFIVIFGIPKRKLYAAVLVQTWLTCFHRRLLFLVHFVRLQRRPACQFRFQIRLPWWPDLMNILQDGPSSFFHHFRRSLTRSASCTPTSSTNTTTTLQDSTASSSASVLGRTLCASTTWPCQRSSPSSTPLSWSASTSSSTSEKKTTKSKFVLSDSAEHVLCAFTWILTLWV